MTITHLRHKEINKERWDSCIKNAPNGNICAMSWYLDIVCENWDALVLPDYSAVFPLTHRSKAGIDYLMQPPFTQQLGLFSRDFVTPAMLHEFMNAIPKSYKLVEINLNKWCKDIHSRFNPAPNVSHELDLIYPYETIEKAYSENVRRNSKKALKNGIYLTKHVRPADVTEMFSIHRGKTIHTLGHSDYKMMQHIMHLSTKNNTGELWGAFDSKDELCAAAFFAGTNGRLIFLFSAINQSGREHGAMFLLIDNYIKQHAETPFVLDFEGSNDENLSRFYGSFGAKKYLYNSIQLNNLPYLVKLFHTFYRKLKYRY